MMGSEGVFSPLIPRKSGQISVTILEDVPQPALSPPEPIWYSSFPPSCPSNLGLAILTSTGAMSEGRTQDGSLHPVTKVPDFTVSESDYGLGGRSMAKINLGTPKINKTQSFQFNRDRSGSESSSISAATVEKGMLWQNLPTGPLRAGTPLLVGSCDNLAAISVSSSDRSLASRVKGEEIIQANMGPGVIGRASEEEPTSRLPVPDVGNKVEFQSSKISLGKDTLVSKVARKSHAEDRIIFSGTISQKFRDPTVHIDQHCVTSPPLMTTGDDDETAAIDQALRSIEALITDYRSPKSYFPDKRMELSRRRSLDLPVNGAAALIPFTPSTAKTATRKRSATDVTAENRKMSRHFEERRGSLLSGKRICPAKGHTSQPSLSHRTRPSTTSSSMSFYSAGSTPPTSLIRTVHKLKYEGLKLKTNYHRQNPRNLSGSKSDIFSPSAASDDAAEALNAFFESRSIPYPNGSETSRKSDGCGEAAQHDSVILPSTINEESMSDSRSDGSSASSSDQTLVEPFHCGTNDSMASVLELDVEALCSISIGTSNPGLGIDLSQKKMPTSFKVGDKACTSAKMDENQHGFSNLTGALPDMRDSWTFLMSTPTKAFPAGNQKECSRRFVRWHSQPHGSPSPAQKITHAIPTRATTLDLGTRRSGKADIAPIIEISMDTPLSISPGSPPRAKLINEAASPLRRGRKSFGSEYNSPTLSVVRLYENRHSNSSFPEREISP
ncbi:hypothetical protein IE53DRAFT_384668 [Violaceomyces palustris]|uniref:Uncharacterized protein n=1 Tax=Violaceomyces palustris TaxID=1673888 RepID=A0ACD0P4F0_9BASI|nr:hypothetical protein IE53DRAFT_384668 [Violaceomyces palustris]